MGRGKYERTELTKARHKKAMIENRIERLLAALSTDESELNNLEELIEQLERENA